MARRSEKPLKDAPARRIFLSASVPLPSRNAVYYNSADVIAIRDAVRALMLVVIEKKAELVFGGHPAISPMIRLQVSQTGQPVGDRVVMYQSRFFGRTFPDDNRAFERIVYTNAVDSDRQKSLVHMRETMLGGTFECGIFIGGMEGVEEEYKLFKKIQKTAPAYPIASTGAAAAIIFDADTALQNLHPKLQNELSYISLMRTLVGSPPRRNQRKLRRNPT